MAGPALAVPAVQLDKPRPLISLTLPAPEVTFGQEASADLIVSVPPVPGGPNPTGIVAVLSRETGSAVCEAQIPSGATVVDCHLRDDFLQPGGYHLFAAYSGDGNYFGTDSSANPQSFTVDKQPTTTTLALPADTLTSGQQAGALLTFHVTAAISGTPTGSVTVTEGSTPICSSVLANGTGNCALATKQLILGTHLLTATYSADSEFAGSTSDAQTLTITKAASTTTLRLSAPSVTIGDEQAENLSVEVTGDGGPPTGSVTISAGSVPVCSSPLLGGFGSCALTADELPVGTYHLTATYDGDGDFAGSASDPQPLTIMKASATTTLTLSAAKTTFGHEQAEGLSVQVTGTTDISPTGQVSIKAGSTNLCMITLTGGRGSCNMAATKLRPGTYHLTAIYGGDGTYAGSTSGPKVLAVASEPTTTALTLSTATVKLGHEQAEHLTVTVNPRFSGTPAGKVTITANATTICTITLTAGKGSCTLGARRLRPGKYTLTAAYLGTAPYARSTSPKKTLTVTK